VAAKETPFSIECNVISVQRWVLPGLKRLLENDGEPCHASPRGLGENGMIDALASLAAPDAAENHHEVQ